MNTLNKFTDLFIGEYQLDVATHTLSCRGVSMRCTTQVFKLLYAFANAPDGFLSNDDIARICDWDSQEKGVPERRRAAIKLLRKLFDETVRFVSDAERKGYQMIVTLHQS